MLSAQPALLQPVPAVARYLTFRHEAGGAITALREALARLQGLTDGQSLVVGLGPSLVHALGSMVPGLHELAPLDGPAVHVPATPASLWCWLRGSDRGDLLHLTRALKRALAPAFALETVVDAFHHRVGEGGLGRDLTGYEDGTENPQGQEALDAALVQHAGSGLDGSSLVAVQQWTHDFDAFEAMGPAQADQAVGRRRVDNEELEDAPESAHVKRTAQEGFEPPAFVLRRSMPWMDAQSGGLMFVAFGSSLAAFEAQMRRMAGLDDGIIDAMFSLSRPVTSASFWCPPMADGRLDLRAVGL